jgi:hypothetical protein
MVLMQELRKKFGEILNCSPLSGMFLFGHSSEKFETSALRTMLTLHLHGWAPGPRPTTIGPYIGRERLNGRF